MLSDAFCFIFYARLLVLPDCQVCTLYVAEANLDDTVKYSVEWFGNFQPGMYIIRGFND